MTLDLAAGEAVRFNDVLHELFAYEGAAALAIQALGGYVVASSRTYNQSASGSFGQFVPAVPLAQAARYGDQALLLQLANAPTGEEGFRTNLGCVNVTGGGIMMEVDLFRADGSVIAATSRWLWPFEYAQLNNVFGEVGMARIDNAYAVVRTATAGGAFISYASVVDNRSQDAVFVPAQVVPEVWR